MTKPTKLSEIDTAKLTFTELKAGGKEGKFGNIFSMMEENHYLNFLKLKHLGEMNMYRKMEENYTMTLQITKEMEESDKEISAAIEGLQKFEKDLENMQKVIV